MPSHRAASIVNESDNGVVQIEEESITFTDQGELLLCKNLSKQQEEDDEQWLHHKIFHTFDTSHGKVCDIIATGSSFENVNKYGGEIKAQGGGSSKNPTHSLGLTKRRSK